MIEIKNICSIKINEYEEMEKKDIKLLNKKRERTNDKTIDDNSSIEICFSSKVKCQNIENNDSKKINEEYIYVGCEDGNIKLVKLNNESIFNIFFC